MKIELDFPPAELFPNRSKGKHWSVTHTARSNYRQVSGWLTKHQMKDWKPTDAQIRLTITFLMPDKRLRDTDNCLAAAKAGLDGMADALGVNDRQFQPVIVYRQHGEKPGKMIVELDII
jgi:Holliday junction resolvase RusA-like endonuclease